MPGTLVQIAQELGTSVSTVSRALAGKAGVAPARRAEIQALARRLGLAPNSQAQALRTGRGQGLTLIVPWLPPAISALRQNAALSAAQAAFGQVRVIVHAARDSLDQTLGQALAGQPQAILLSLPQQPLNLETVALLRRRGVALAAMDAALPGVDSVQIDRVAGMYQAARLLLLSGCQRPVFYSLASLAAPDPRVEGILRAYRSLGLPSSAARLLPVTGTDPAAGFAMGQRVLASEAVDGLFCCNDELAIGTLKALRLAGVRVPEDVRLIGFDDLPSAEFAACPLTTVAQPVAAVAEAAVAMCLARLANPDLPPQLQTFPTRLVVRDSAPMPAHALRQQVFQTPEADPVPAPDPTTPKDTP